MADAESIAIHANHLDMVKFDTRENGGYEVVSGHLQILAQEAPDIIAAQWAKQEEKSEGRTTTL